MSKVLYMCVYICIYIYVYIYIYIYIYCDTCPGHLSASPWQRRRFTCKQSQRADRSQLRLLRRGLQKLGQHRVWGATTPEGSQLMTLCVFFQKAVDRSARPTSTGHRTHCTQPAGEQDHGARENHYRHVGTFTLLCLFNKHTLRGPFCTITCRVILQPATLVENAGRLLKNHRHPTITVTSLFLFPSPPPFVSVVWIFRQAATPLQPWKSS